MLFFISCEKKIETQNWSPEIITPLANVKLTLADLIPEEGSVVYDEDNFIRLAYRDDNIFSFTADSVINIPTQEGFSEYYSFQDLPINDFNEEIDYTLEQVLTSDPTIQFFAEAAGIQIPFPDEQQVSAGVFNILSDELDGLGQTDIELNQFSEISFIAGDLSIGIQNNLPIDIEDIEVNLSTGVDDIGLLQFSNLQVGEIQYLTTDLSGLTIDNNMLVDFLNLTLEEVDPINEFTITPNSGIKIFFQITNINVDSVTMAFQNQQLA